MIYIIAILLGIVSGVFAKGRIANFIELKFQKIWLILFAALVLIFLQLTGDKFDFVRKNIIIFQGSIFLLLFAGFWFNRKYMGIFGLWLGSFSNMLVMMLNGGKMPVSLDAVKRANLPLGLASIDAKHQIIDKMSSIRLFFMADIITPPGFLGIGMKVVSFGDLIIALGLFIFILQVIIGKKREKNT